MLGAEHVAVKKRTANIHALQRSAHNANDHKPYLCLVNLWDPHADQSKWMRGMQDASLRFTMRTATPVEVGRRKSFRRYVIKSPTG